MALAILRKQTGKITINAFVLTFDIYRTDCSENSYYKKLLHLDLNTALLKSKFRLHKCKFFSGNISKLGLGQTELTITFSGRLIFSILWKFVFVYLFLSVSPRINISGEKPKDRSWHTLTPIGDDRLFLFGGLSSDNVPLSK